MVDSEEESGGSSSSSSRSITDTNTDNSNNPNPGASTISPDEGGLFRRASDLASQLIVLTDASSLKCFIGRWLSIRRKLEALPAQISELADSELGLAKSSLCKELLQALVATLVEAKELATACAPLPPAESFVGGKLQMQSKLDALTLKLALHVQDMELLIKTAAVRRELPTAGNSGGNSGGSSETVRWKVKDLLTRLQIGSVDSRHKALDELVLLMGQSEKSVLVVAGQSGIPTLVHLLDAPAAALREKAATAIFRLTQTSDTYERLLATESAVAPLARLLESGSPLAKEKAVATLHRLTSTSENARSVTSHGGISSLIEISYFGTPFAQAASAGTIRNLSAIAEIQQTLAEEGIIPAMIGLITSGTTQAQIHAADCLRIMASSEEKFKLLIAKEGGIRALLIYFDGATNPTAQEIAIGALSNLSISVRLTEELFKEGFLLRLITALRSSAAAVQQAGAGAVCHFAKSMEMRRTLGEAGCIPPLMKMLEGKTSAAQDLATQALYCLLLVDSNRHRFLKEERGIWLLVQLLDPRTPGVSKKFPVSILLCLSGRRKHRKIMVTAGACAHLEKLSTMEVNDAKKLLETLQGKRIWNVFRVSNTSN